MNHKNKYTILESPGEGGYSLYLDDKDDRHIF